MVKTYCVDIDFVMSKSIEIQAESEEQAMSKVSDIIKNNPYDYACNFGHYVGHRIIDANEV